MESKTEFYLSDPLSQVTRNERKILLGVSAIGLIVLHAGLVPTKIAALGIEFSQIDQKTLLRSIGALVLYFLCAFILYGSSDFVAWRMGLLEKLADPEYTTHAQISGIDIFLSDSEGPILALRACFEFLLPVVIGIVAVFQLFRARV
jgi:hypothetical protein